ncbi:MAG: electron transport complex, RnfABCDGE type, subunit [Clostridiales bacterium]|jgi:electron transport complex protein RnfE|nr:electron transport complex, RnfABCDGE type, subunit [Clostridiales bacterium]
MRELINRLKTGIFTENPTFMQMLGMCPTLAVTTSAQAGLGMGLATTAVLILSNFAISLLRKAIPVKVRIPVFVVLIATFVTIIEMLLKAYVPALYNELGLFIPLIVVNCIILGRAEAYASKNKVLPSVFDGIGMGLGFTFALTLISIVRELLAYGTIFDIKIAPKFYEASTIFASAPGAYFVLGFLLAGIAAIRNKKSSKGRA